MVLPKDLSGKKCTKCGEFKLMHSFHADKRNIDRKQYRCKSCQRGIIMYKSIALSALLLSSTVLANPAITSSRQIGDTTFYYYDDGSTGTSQKIDDTTYYNKPPSHGRSFQDRLEDAYEEPVKSHRSPRQSRSFQDRLENAYED